LVFGVAIGACRSARQNTPSDEEAGGVNPPAFYVRTEGGGSGDGSSWETPLGGLPAVLERGAVYWLASGEYGDYTFDDPSRGQRGITLRKATAEAHGSDTGWKAEYGLGQAVFGPLRFTTGYYTVDGGQPKGLRTVGRMGAGAVVAIDGAHVVLRHVEIDGGLKKAGGKQTAGGCNGIDITEDYAVLDRCEVHNIADDGIGIYASHIKVLDSEIHDLDGCGTDGDCGPCYNGHSDGIEMSGSADVELVGNLIYDVRSNAALFMDDWSGSATRDLLVFNNVFYTPDCGFAVYLQKLGGARVHNNVIWGKTQGNRYGGLAMGQGITDLEMSNNIILNINYSHMGTAQDPAQHRLDFNMFGMINSGEYLASDHDLVGDPQFSGIPLSGNASDHKRVGVKLEDFTATAQSAIDSGTTPSGVPPRDAVDVLRPQGSAWDRGPFELSPR
jgi:hypothetical protein